MKFFNHILYVSLFLLPFFTANATVYDCNRKGRVTGVSINVESGEVYARLETTTKFVKLEQKLTNGTDGSFARLVAKSLLNSLLFYEVVKLNCSDVNNDNFKSISLFQNKE